MADATSPTWHRLGTRDELLARVPFAVKLERHRIAVFLHDGRFTAISDICNHKGGPLSEGPALVIADVRDGGEAAVVEKHGDAVALELDGEGNAGEQLVARAEAVPGRGCGVGHAGLRREIGICYAPFQSGAPARALHGVDFPASCPHPAPVPVSASSFS